MVIAERWLNYRMFYCRFQPFQSVELSLQERRRESFLKTIPNCPAGVLKTAIPNSIHPEGWLYKAVVQVHRVMVTFTSSGQFLKT